MADKVTKKKPARSKKLTDNAAKEPYSETKYMAAAYSLSEDEVQTLRTAPTAELTQKFMASALAKAKLCDQLQMKEPRRSNNKSTKRETHPCDFMRLPQELRLQIFEMIFQDALENSIPSDEIDPEFQSYVHNAVSGHVQTAMDLAHTSRELRHEALSACIKVADDIQKKAWETLARLRPGYKYHPRYLFLNTPYTISGSRAEQKRFGMKCADLELRYIDAKDICKCLQWAKADGVKDYERKEAKKRRGKK